MMHRLHRSQVMQRWLAFTNSLLPIGSGIGHLDQDNWKGLFRKRLTLESFPCKLSISDSSDPAYSCQNARAETCAHNNMSDLPLLPFCWSLTFLTLLLQFQTRARHLSTIWLFNLCISLRCHCCSTSDIEYAEI